ncbi:MAG: hypothetical protein ACLUA4_01605 [Bifidobacterium sp.]
MNNAVGLVKLLAGDVDARTAVQRYWKPEMQVLPVEETSTSNVILGSNVMRDMVDQATRHYDHVIIDTAPIQVSNDASVFARSVVRCCSLSARMLMTEEGSAQYSARAESRPRKDWAVWRSAALRMSVAVRATITTYEESEVKNRRAKASTGDSSQNSASRNARRGRRTTADGR